MYRQLEIYCIGTLYRELINLPLFSNLHPVSPSSGKVSNKNNKFHHWRCRGNH